MLRRPTVPLVLAVTLFCGVWAWGSDLGMGIDSVTQKGGVITVTTTGAKFQIDGRRAIRCWQRIPREREVLNVRFEKPVGPFRIEKKDGFSCTVSCRAGELTFHGDSLAILKLNEATKTVFKGLFSPAYHFEKQGKWILMDGEGGFGIYPVAKKSTLSRPASRLPGILLTSSAAGTRHGYPYFRLGPSTGIAPSRPSSTTACRKTAPLHNLKV